MIRINFICHGNICRSTMAESVMTHLVKKNNLLDKYEITSSATSTEEIGNPPHYGTVSKLNEENIPCIAHRAKQITKKDAHSSDYLICMDNNNVRNLKRLINREDYNKISLLLSWAGEERNIADPWYTGNFDETFNDVYEGCIALLDKLEK